MSDIQAWWDSLSQEEKTAQIVRQKIINGNDGSVPDPMIYLAMGFPLPREVEETNPHAFAIIKGREFTNKCMETIFEWTNQDKNEKNFIEVPVKLNPGDIFMICWLYNQFNNWASGNLDRTSSATSFPVDNDKMQEFLSGFIRPLVDDAIGGHDALLRNGDHPLTHEIKRKPKKRGFFG